MIFSVMPSRCTLGGRIASKSLELSQKFCFGKEYLSFHTAKTHSRISYEVMARQNRLNWNRCVAPVPIQPILTRHDLIRDSAMGRSEEHTSELQSHLNLVFRLLLEKKKYHIV